LEVIGLLSSKFDQAVTLENFEDRLVLVVFSVLEWSEGAPKTEDVDHILVDILDLMTDDGLVENIGNDQCPRGHLAEDEFCLPF
jgi:hypothetical protein